MPIIPVIPAELNSEGKKMIISVKLLTRYVIRIYKLGSVHQKFGVWINGVPKSIQIQKLIPSRARRKEQLSRSKLKQAFLIDSDAELFMYLVQCIRFGSWKVLGLFTPVSLRNMPNPFFSNQIAFPCLAYFSEIAAIYCMISTDRQHQLVYSISSLKQVRFITTEQDLSLATRFMLSSLEPIKCMPFSRESVPKFGTLFLIRLKYLNVRPFVKK